MYSAEGGVVTGDSYSVLPPIPAVQDFANELGTGYGGWVAANDREFRLTFYSVMVTNTLARASPKRGNGLLVVNRWVARGLSFLWPARL